MSYQSLSVEERTVAAIVTVHVTSMTTIMMTSIKFRTHKSAVAILRKYQTYPKEF